MPGWYTGQAPCKGPYLNDVYKIFWFFDPLPPCLHLSDFLEPPSLADVIFGLNPPPLSGTSSPAYSTSRLLGKEGKPGENELTKKSVEQNRFILKLS